MSEYNTNNAWYYNGNNGTLNNNNKNNSNQCRPSLAHFYDDDHLFDYPITYADFLTNYKICRKHKRRKASQMIFEHNQVEELIRLCHEVNMGEYEQRPSIAFIITYPKVREVIAADFRDRVAQTILVQKLTPYLDKYLHEDSYACRLNKGGLKAAQKFQQYVYELSNGYTEDCYVFSLDIKAFFPSIDTEFWTEKLLAFVDECYEEADIEVVKWLIRWVYLYKPQYNCVRMSPMWMWDMLDPAKSMFGKTDGIGLPIGNVTSQMLALFVTTKPLRWLEAHGVRFVCYTDDIKGVVKDKKAFPKLLPEFRQYVWEECHLRLHPDKFDIQHYSKGIRVASYRLRFDRMQPSGRIAHNCRYKIGKLIARAAADEKYVYREKESAMATINSYLGMLRHCQSYRLRSEMIEQLKASEWAKVFVFDKDCEKVNIKSKFTEKRYYRLKSKERKRQTNKSLSL